MSGFVTPLGVDSGGVARVLAALEDRQPHLMVPDLARMTELADLLGSPQLSYPSIHLTGTNGKTSTARMIDSLLRAHGVRTGRYTSPHLQRVHERISVFGVPLTDAQLVTAYDDVAAIVEFVDSRHSERVTYFELLTAMAFAFFADVPVDAGVIEVGLGGAWDATNVLDAGVSVVTPISLDHTELLGSTLGEIATEKSGIFRAGQTVILGRQQLEAATALLRTAVDVGAIVAREGVEFAVTNRAVAVGGQVITVQGLHGAYDEVFLPLHGAHQAHNAALALCAVEAFVGSMLEPEVVREGFATADSPGRLEVVRSAPTTILDGAHNPAGAVALAETLAEAFHFDRVIGVIAMLREKDSRGFLEALESVLDRVVVTASLSPRALPVAELAAVAESVFGPDRVTVATALPEALEVAVRYAEEDLALGGGGIVVTGSLVTVGEARTLLR